MSFIEGFARLKLCLFRYVFCRNLAKLLSVVFVQFYTTVVNNGLLDPYLLLTNSSFTSLSESCTGDVLFGSNLSKFRSKNLKASLMSSTRALFSDKARCFSQSEHALYGNFIII